MSFLRNLCLRKQVAGIYPSARYEVVYETVRQSQALHHRNIYNNIGKQNVTYHTADGTPEVRMKANGIQQVFLNLTTNALNVLERREKKEIHVDIRRDGEFVQATIGDTGGGIVPENVQRIFDPFFTTKPFV